MKRSLTIATALLLCAASSAAFAGQDKKDKDRDRPAPTQPARPQSSPAPQRQERPTFQPQPRAAQPSPSLQRQERPAFQPQPRPQPSTSLQAPNRNERPTPPAQPAPRIDRTERPDRAGKPDRGVQAERPNRPDQAQRPDTARPADRPNKARPEATPQARPRPQANDTARPARPPKTPRPAIAERGPAKARPDRAALPKKPDRAKAARPARPASPAAIARTRAIHQALKADRARTFHFRGRTLRVVKARPYRYPAGWRYRAWRRHQHFPRELFLSAWFINNFLGYGLSTPPAGYYWVRYGPDAVLVDGSSYDIADTAYGVFDDGSGYGGYDEADLPPIDPDLPQAFADGSLDLASGVDQSGACGFFYGDRQTQDDIDAAWAAQDWNGLAKTVIWAGCGNDVSYYLLGLAAEGLALPDASANYYGRAIDLADGNVDSTFKCAESGADTCRGLDIAAEASNGLDRIYGPAQQ